METKCEPRQMIIKINAVTGKLISVTDEAGVPAEQFTPTPENPMPLGAVLGSTGGDISLLITRTNPCYSWVRLGGGGWARIPVPCP